MENHDCNLPQHDQFSVHLYIWLRISSIDLLPLNANPPATISKRKLECRLEKSVYNTTIILVQHCIRRYNITIFLQAQDFYSLNADIAAAAAAANEDREGRNLDLSVSEITDIKNLDGQTRRKFSG